MAKIEMTNAEAESFFDEWGKRIVERRDWGLKQFILES